VFLSWAEALLKSENIEIFALDGHMSVLEGSAGAIQRRIMVARDDYERAKRLLTDAGEGDRVV
tara:strand:- start:661 stop:849 length:189 start_codon:yes stop_codon:yes gene_type:complete